MFFVSISCSFSFSLSFSFICWWVQHLATSLDNHDSFIESQNIHNSPLKALLRDVNADPMSDMSAVAISKRESSMLKSREKSSDFCSLLCAYRLLDVIISLERTTEKLHAPPLHNQIGTNLFNNEVCSYFIYVDFFFLMKHRDLCDLSKIGLTR